MHGNLSRAAQEAILAAAASCETNGRLMPTRHDLAEPLWFAIMCRQLWGANAPKELQFLLEKSDRTCRAWAAGDAIPLATILAVLIVGPQGGRILEHLMRESPSPWWAEHERARRITAQVDQLDLR